MVSCSLTLTALTHMLLPHSTCVCQGCRLVTRLGTALGRPAPLFSGCLPQWVLLCRWASCAEADTARATRLARHPQQQRWAGNPLQSNTIVAISSPCQALAGGCTHPHLMLQGDKVKSGQVLGYVEQLGTFVPIEVGCSLSFGMQNLSAGAQLGQPATVACVLGSCMAVSCGTLVSTAVCDCRPLRRERLSNSLWMRATQWPTRWMS